MKGTLSALKRHPSTEGNCLTSSPIEGGFRGCAFQFFIEFLFHLFWYLKDRLSCFLAALVEDKNTVARSPPSSPTKGEDKILTIFKINIKTKFE